MCQIFNEQGFLIVLLTTWITVTNQCGTCSGRRWLPRHVHTNVGFCGFAFSAVTQTFENLFLNVLLDRHLFYHFWQISSPHGFLLFVQFSVCSSPMERVSTVVYAGQRRAFSSDGTETGSTGEMQVQQKSTGSYYVLLINNMAIYFCCLSVKWRDGENCIEHWDRILD